MTDTLFCHTLRPLSRCRYTLAPYFVPNIYAKDISEVSWRSAISAGTRHETYYILLRKYWSVKYHLLIRGSTIRIPPLSLSFSDYESFPLYFDPSYPTREGNIIFLLNFVVCDTRMRFAVLRVSIISCNQMYTRNTQIFMIVAWSLFLFFSLSLSLII